MKFDLIESTIYKSDLQSKTPDVAAIGFFKTTDYVQINGAHHYFYKGN